MVIAYELEMRWCHAADPGIREIGWHHASLTQFVSPLVAGRMYDLDVDQLVAAVGISGSSHFTLGGVVAGHLTNMKNTADPMAAHQWPRHSQNESRYRYDSEQHQQQFLQTLESPTFDRHLREKLHGPPHNDIRLSSLVEVQEHRGDDQRKCCQEYGAEERHFLRNLFIAARRRK